MKLTAASVADLKLGEGETDRIWFDDSVPGFGLRVRDSGSRNWIYQYKLGGKTRRLALGQASAIKVARAREIAGELHAKVRLGGDPAGEKRLKIERAAHTFYALVQRYLEQHKRQVRERTYKEVERALLNYAELLHALPVDTIDQRTIAERLTAIEKASGGVTSNRVRACMSAMFSWGMREGLVLVNPVANTNKREERPRDRVLSDTELRAIWQALPNSQYGTIVKLLMLTGQRVNEIGGLCWSEIGDTEISLPGVRTKNGRTHVIPLGPTVRDLLKAQPQIEGRDFVFGEGVGAFSGWSGSKAKLDANLNIAAWVLHDVRRSVATGMADIGIQPHIIEAVLNHVSGHKGGVAGIYNRASYAREKAEALARWDKHIGAVVKESPSKVVGLRGRR